MRYVNRNGQSRNGHSAATRIASQGKNAGSRGTVYVGRASLREQEGTKEPNRGVSRYMFRKHTVRGAVYGRYRRGLGERVLFAIRDAIGVVGFALRLCGKGDSGLDTVGLDLQLGIRRADTDADGFHHQAWESIRQGDIKASAHASGLGIRDGFHRALGRGKGWLCREWELGRKTEAYDGTV